MDVLEQGYLKIFLQTKRKTTTTATSGTTDLRNSIRYRSCARFKHFAFGFFYVADRLRLFERLRWYFVQHTYGTRCTNFLPGQRRYPTECFARILAAPVKTSSIPSMTCGIIELFHYNIRFGGTPWGGEHARCKIKINNINKKKTDLSNENAPR